MNFNRNICEIAILIFYINLILGRIRKDFIKIYIWISPWSLRMLILANNSPIDYWLNVKFHYLFQTKANHPDQ